MVCTFSVQTKTIFTAPVFYAQSCSLTGICVHIRNDFPDKPVAVSSLGWAIQFSRLVAPKLPHCPLEKVVLTYTRLPQDEVQSFCLLFLLLLTRLREKLRLHREPVKERPTSTIHCELVRLRPVYAASFLSTVNHRDAPRG